MVHFSLRKIALKKLLKSILDYLKNGEAYGEGQEVWQAAEFACCCVADTLGGWTV